MTHCNSYKNIFVAWSRIIRIEKGTSPHPRLRAGKLKWQLIMRCWMGRWISEKTLLFIGIYSSKKTCSSKLDMDKVKSLLPHLHHALASTQGEQRTIFLCVLVHNQLGGLYICAWCKYEAPGFKIVLLLLGSIVVFKSEILSDNDEIHWAGTLSYTEVIWSFQHKTSQYSHWSTRLQDAFFEESFQIPNTCNFSSGENSGENFISRRRL